METYFLLCAEKRVLKAPITVYSVINGRTFTKQTGFSFHSGEEMRKIAFRVFGISDSENISLSSDHN